MRKVVVIILFALFLFIGILWWKNGTSPVNKLDLAKKVFVVERGAGVRQIANELKQQGLIRDPIVFFLHVKKTGQDKKIQAGDYKLSPSMNLSQIVNELSFGTVDIWVTVQEGLRAEEIADILKKNIPSYDESWRAKLIANEGYLFPDTYLIPKTATIEQVLSIFKTNFDKKIEEAGINSSSASLPNVIKRASLIEREALFDSDRVLVSSVLDNRLRIGMKLDIDAAVQYALGKQPNGRWWKKSLTFEDIKFDSPYNTYTNPGLPPTPISNPGIASIKAAADPSQSDYLYYVSDSKGHLHFAETFKEHQANIRKYL